MGGYAVSQHVTVTNPANWSPVQNGSTENQFKSVNEKNFSPTLNQLIVPERYSDGFIDLNP